MGYWFVDKVAPRVGPPLLRLTGGRLGTGRTPRSRSPIVERDRAWDLALDLYSGYVAYEGRAGDRTIPLVRWSPLGLSYPQT
jgi:hypothetical protein